ncbi:branched-chain amino acid ABC transporter permease [Lampropedia puyangensis]|uniref:Branched-chain amino acid ABC transporter permease n=1 Tax=Lampropedia puyangensis TaxID=1330072 RepID=A0A4S8FA08_9BURK|nr:AzlC family ABC transporter permease [Lampropedia puyangensis]THU04097.1 branched-chain amino acid ABC transporter permease [Lampropedia puyangensis]
MKAFLRGLCASLPIAAGYFPVALSFGISAIEAGLPAIVAFAISLLVYAGASQFLLISLLTSGAGMAASIPTVWLMNARHLFYGPSLARSWPDSPAHAKSDIPTAALAFGLTDEVFATAQSKISAIAAGDRTQWYFGLACGAYLAWLAGTATGIFLVGDLHSWPLWLRESLRFVLPALFFTLLLESQPKQWHAAIGVAAICALVLLMWLPSYHALLIAMVAGAAAHALWLQQRQTKCNACEDLL